MRQTSHRYLKKPKQTFDDLLVALTSKKHLTKVPFFLLVLVQALQMISSCLTAVYNQVIKYLKVMNGVVLGLVNSRGHSWEFTQAEPGLRKADMSFYLEVSCHDVGPGQFTWSPNYTFAQADLSRTYHFVLMFLITFSRVKLVILFKCFLARSWNWAFFEDYCAEFYQTAHSFKLT